MSKLKSQFISDGVHDIGKPLPNGVKLFSIDLIDGSPHDPLATIENVTTAEGNPRFKIKIGPESVFMGEEDVILFSNTLMHAVCLVKEGKAGKPRG